MGTYYSCRSCGNSEEGDSLYRCWKCRKNGVLHAGRSAVTIYLVAIRL